MRYLDEIVFIAFQERVKTVLKYHSKKLYIVLNVRFNFFHIPLVTYKETQKLRDEFKNSYFLISL